MKFEAEHSVLDHQKRTLYIKMTIFSIVKAYSRGGGGGGPKSVNFDRAYFMDGPEGSVIGMLKIPRDSRHRMLEILRVDCIYYMDGIKHQSKTIE